MPIKILDKFQSTASDGILVDASAVLDNDQTQDIINDSLKKEVNALNNTVSQLSSSTVKPDNITIDFINPNEKTIGVKIADLTIGTDNRGLFVKLGSGLHSDNNNVSVKLGSGLYITTNNEISISPDLNIDDLDDIKSKIESLSTDVTNLKNVKDDSGLKLNEEGSLEIKLSTGLRKDSNGISVTPTFGHNTGPRKQIILSSDPSNTGDEMTLFELGSGFDLTHGENPTIKLQFASTSPLKADADGLGINIGTGLQVQNKSLSLGGLIAGTDENGGFIRIGTQLKLFNLGTEFVVSTGVTPKIQLNLEPDSPLSANNGYLSINLGTGLRVGGEPRSIGVNIGKGLTIGQDGTIVVSLSQDYLTTDAYGVITIDINKLKSAILDIEYLKEALGLI